MSKDNILLSASILISALLVSASLVYKVDRGENSAGPGLDNEPANEIVASEIKFRPVDNSDHIRGDLSSPVKMIEYSDLECPFCSRIHPTLARITAEYDGKVAWVYRHFPLESIHAKARAAAVGSECASELGGDDAFWKFIDAVFQDQQGALLDLPGVASKIGLNKTGFESCLNSNKYASKVSADAKDAENSGGRGTPWVIVINSDGETYPINGALPYEQAKSIIEKALQ